MGIAVTYYSKNGSSKRLAEAIADAAGCTATDISTIKLPEAVDLLFIGGAIYGGKLDISLQQFISSLDPEKVRRAVVFSTFAFGETANEKTKALLKEQKIQVDDKCFTCKGKFLFFNRKRPNSADIDAAKQFAKSIINSKS